MAENPIQYPKVMYHPDQGQTLVGSKEDKDKLGDGWVESPADFAPAATFTQPITSQVTEGEKETQAEAEVRVETAALDYSTMSKNDLLARATQTYGKAIPASTSKDDIIAELKKLDKKAAA